MLGVLQTIAALPKRYYEILNMKTNTESIKRNTQTTETPMDEEVNSNSILAVFQ